jgi:hypothetical protein
MTIAHRRRTDTDPSPEDLIREARRRQRRRQVVIVFVVVAVAGSVAAVVAELGGRQAGPAGPPPRTKAAGPAPTGATTYPPLIGGADTNLLMWPAGPTAFSASGGPPAHFENLATGRIRESAQLNIGACDFQPLLAATGRWLVYVGTGTTVMRDDLRGKPRVLAATPFFVPAADPGRVWLFRFRPGTHRRIRAWTESAAGGRPSRTVTLPAGDYLPAVRGTEAGLLLQTRHGLALWKPGGVPRPLPFSPNISDGFDATSRLIAYGTGCASHVTNAKETPYEANAGYDGCRMLRIFDVVTGKMLSFPAPAGSVGWVPNGFDLVSAFSPQGSMIAAYAAVRPAGSGRVRLYVLRTRGPAKPSRPVSSSAAFLFARTAWSVRGGWLLYQGAGVHLWAYQPGTGITSKSTTSCCRYLVLVSVPLGGHAAG